MTCFLVSHSLQEIQKVKERISETFEVKDMGEAAYTLGMQITRDKQAGVIELKQESFINAILQKFGMTDCNPVLTPMDANQKLHKGEVVITSGERDTLEGLPYQQVVGSIMYLMVCTQPDIAFAVSTLSQFMTRPTMEHWRAVQRVLRYLKGTKELSLTFKRMPEGNELVGYCDAGFGEWTGDGKSVTGVFFKLAGGAITWGSKKQDTVALSTTEAEYMAGSTCGKDALWIREVLTAMGSCQDGPTSIYSDSQTALALIKHPVHHQRTRHIHKRYHFIREHVARGELTFKFVATGRQPADGLTKALPAPKFLQCRSAYGLAASEKEEK